MAKRRKIEPGEYRIPDFIRVDGDRWCIATRATVAAWRKARQVGMTDDAKHTLLQYRAATQLLELAQEHDLPDDAVVIATLLGATNEEEATNEEAAIVEGADGIWRNKCDLKPALQLVK